MAVDVDRAEFDALQTLVNQLQTALGTLQTQVNGLQSAGGGQGVFTQADDQDQISGSDNIPGDGEKQHLLLKVSDFQGAGDNEPMDTFLHLGAADASPSGVRAGDDLIAKAFFDPDDRDQSGRSDPLNLKRDLESPFDGSAKERIDAENDGRALFIDDIRKGASEDEVDIFGDGLAQSRVKSRVSAEITTRGGWRDHSDGNRISTTRGDKVEVIRGNYKLVVLGRQDDPAEGTELDASGGIVQETDVTPGGIYEVKIVPTSDNKFKVVEFADRGDLHTVFNGPVLEEYRGEFVSHWGSRFNLTPKWEEKIFSKIIFSEENAGVIHHQYAAGLMTEMWAGPFIETFGGLNVSVAIGGNIGVTLGLDVDLAVALKYELLLGYRTEVAIGTITEIVAADWMEICAEDHLVISRKVYNIAGEEVELVGKRTDLAADKKNYAASEETIRIKTKEFAIDKKGLSAAYSHKAMKVALGV